MCIAIKLCAICDVIFVSRHFVHVITSSLRLIYSSNQLPRHYQLAFLRQANSTIIKKNAREIIMFLFTQWKMIFAPTLPRFLRLLDLSLPPMCRQSPVYYYLSLSLCEFFAREKPKIEIHMDKQTGTTCRCRLIKHCSPNTYAATRLQ